MANIHTLERNQKNHDKLIEDLCIHYYKYYVVQELELETHDIFLSSNYSKISRFLFEIL